MTGLGGGVGAAAPGDYVYFKSVVPLHKISVSASVLPKSPSTISLFYFHPRARTDFSAASWRGLQFGGPFYNAVIRVPFRPGVVDGAASPPIGSLRVVPGGATMSRGNWVYFPASLSLVLFVLGSVFDFS